VEGVPLFTTTEEAWSMKDSFFTNPDVAYLFERDAPETKGKKIMAAALSGIFPSWFSGAAKPLREGSEEELPDMPADATPARIVVIGDTDMASSLMSAALGQRNLNFLLQAVDWLGNDDDIIGIRSRSSQLGRLDRLTDARQKAGVMRFAQVLNVVLIPLLVILLGLGAAWRRKTRAAAAGLGEDKEHSDGV
jgi:hypothetical protein